MSYHRTIFYTYTFLTILGCSLVYAQNNTPVESSKGDVSSSHNESDPSPSLLTLESFLNQVAVDGCGPLHPDIRNGLIRVATLTVESDVLDLATRELLTVMLNKKIAQQSNMITASSQQVRQIMRTFAVQDLSLSNQRALTLGRMLGVRFVFVTQVSDDGDHLLFKTKVLSIKRKGSLFESQTHVKKNEVKKLKDDHIFYESKTSALWRSALLPGWGQFYQDRSHMGILYALTSVSLLVGGIMSYQDGQYWSQLYQEKTASTVPYRQRANQAFSRANIFWSALATAWVINAFDAYFSGKTQSKSKIDLHVSPLGGLTLSSSF